MLSDIVYLFVYHIFKYRYDIVTNNLVNAFPDKTEKEIKEIRKKFYKHMCDMFMEMIKSITISDQETQKRYQIINPDFLNQVESKGKSLMLLAGHYANYEWGNVIDLTTKKRCVGVYKKIKNPHFEKLVLKMRSRFGSEVVLNNKIMKYAVAKERNSETKGNRIYCLLTDQTPKPNPKNYMVTFMGQDVPAFVGSEVLARKLDLEIVYFKVNKVKRGFYQVEIVPITDNVNSLDKFKATDKYYELLENQIKEQPEFYLWTHKRWKHAN